MTSLANTNPDLDLISQLTQDDPRLIQILKNWFLESPPDRSVPYNFEQKNPNLYGQIGQPNIIDRILNQVKFEVPTFVMKLKIVLALIIIQRLHFLFTNDFNYNAKANQDNHKVNHRVMLSKFFMVLISYVNFQYILNGCLANLNNEDV